MKLSFKLRVLLSLLLVALIPLLICSLLMVRIFEVNLRSRTWEDGEAQMVRVIERLSERFASYAEATRIVADDPLVAQLLLKPDELRKDEVYLALYRATDSLRAAVQFQLYDSGGVLRYTTDAAPTVMSLPLDRGVLRQALDTGEMACTDLDSSESQRVLMRCARVIPDRKGGAAGFVVASLTEKSFSDTFGGLYAQENTLYLTDRFFAPVYASVPRDTEERVAALRAQYMQTGALSVDPDSDLRYHLRTEPLSGCFVVMEQPAQITGDAMQLMNTISLSATAVCVALCVAAAFLLSRSLTKPLEQLSRAMEQVKQGDFGVRVDLKRSDELGSLAESFNRMAGDLDVYMQSLVQRQRELNDVRIRMLQAQLNPHFLYNTLDTMKWTSKMRGVPEAASLAENLAIILRRSISEQRFVTLRQELELSQRYADIQKIRFSERFRCVFEVPERLLDCFVPKLVLQPLLENAIIHGLRDSDSGYLYVYALEKDGELRLSVTDNGCGMPPEMVEQLNSGACRQQEGHLGLYNVSTILRMYYGEPYGLRASAIPDIGTTVTAVLPLQREVPQDDEDCNC